MWILSQLKIGQKKKEREDAVETFKMFVQMVGPLLMALLKLRPVSETSSASLMWPDFHQTV